MTTALTTAQVLKQFLPRYRQQARLTPQQAKVASLLCNCRTEALGGYRLACDHCGFQQEHFRSCGNRHCPQCHGVATQNWLTRRREDLLPVPYFHVVFTLPHSLNPGVKRHPETLYAVLFRAVWQTLKTFGEDPKRLDGQLGMTAVLHTWGQNLSQHVHLHCLIPGGSYHPARDEWHAATSTYLFPVKALSRHFRGQMVSGLRAAYNRGQLAGITDTEEVGRVLNGLMSHAWVVFARGTCQHSNTVLTYLAQYTHRIAISNARLAHMDQDQVTFGYKDYAAGGEHKQMSLRGEEFVRRLLLHVLPHGLMRIRHYGFLANCHRRKRLMQIRRCLQSRTQASVEEGKQEVVVSVVPHSCVSEPSQPCPRCQQGSLWIIGDIAPTKRRYH